MEEVGDLVNTVKCIVHHGFQQRSMPGGTWKVYENMLGCYSGGRYAAYSCRGPGMGSGVLKVVVRMDQNFLAGRKCMVTH